MRFIGLMLICLLLIGCNEPRRESPLPDDGKVKVKVNAPGVNVEVEGKKNQ
jgi:hypothetical protein